MGRPEHERPKKRLGQHFLTDPNTARIVAQGVTRDDVVLEVGPGRGALTTVLAERARLVHALELDPDVLPALEKALEPYRNVLVHEGDALAFDYASLDPRPNKLVANLPYNVASPLVLRLLEEPDLLAELRFMVQLEVARRMAAERRTKDYGAYAVLAQLLAEVRVAHRVSPRVFDPPPRVWSAVVTMERRVVDREDYERAKELVLAAFKNRRKRLINNLPEAWREKAPDALRSLGYGPDARAEELAPEDFVALARSLGRAVMERVRLRAFAKVNYALEVLGVRPDGYHEISTVMQSISLADEVEIERAESGFELVVEPEGAGIGLPEENTVYKAWARLGERIGDALPVRVRLGKKIPAGAGLGGGSADAAATLVGLNVLFGLSLDEAELRDVGLRVGADVPFCLAGGTALGEGIGEVLRSLPAPPPHHLVVAKPAAGAETARIYEAYDERPVGGNPSVAPVVEALRAGEPGGFARSLGNDLAPVTEGLVPEMRALEEALLRAGASGAAMSGTGTAVFGIFASEAEARAAADGLRATFVAVSEPVPRGVEVL